MNICLSHWLQRKNWTLTGNIQKWGCSSLIVGMPHSIHLRCPQFCFWTPRPSGLKTICLFRSNPIDFHWKCLWLLWPWQRSIWPDWFMFWTFSTHVSSFMINRTEYLRTGTVKRVIQFWTVKCQLRLKMLHVESSPTNNAKIFKHIRLS